MSKKVKDHLGNEYSSTSEMCRHYGINVYTYHNRINKYGWTVEEALTVKIVKDHLGNEYPSIADMCRYYGVEAYTYHNIKHGWTVEEALTVKTVKDHLGNEYSSIADMCRYYEIEANTYRSRIKLGWTVEEALTGNHSKRKRLGKSIAIVFRGEKFLSIKDLCDRYGIPRKTLDRHIKKEGSVEAAAEKILGDKNKVKDHLGNKYPSIREMCKHYNVSEGTYHSRIRLGWTLEEALTGKTVKDHLGNEYSSISEMCRHYHINQKTYCKRINRYGWTQEEALTGKRVKTKKTYNGKSCKDHLGNEYPSISEMCRHYNVNENTYRSRIKLGWTVEDALTGNHSKALTGNHSKGKGRGRSIAIVFRGEKFLSIKDLCDRYGIPRKTLARHIKKEGSVEAAAEKILGNKNKVKDHLGNEYPSIKDMCRYYGIEDYTYRNRIKYGWTVEEALCGNHSKDKGWGRSIAIVDHLGNEYHSISEMCKHYAITIWTYYQRIKHGWTTEEALTGKTIKDHLGNEYHSIKEMCSYYGIDYQVYYYRIERGWTLEEALLGKKKKHCNANETINE